MILPELSSTSHIWVVLSVKIAREGEGLEGKAIGRKEEKDHAFSLNLPQYSLQLYLKHFWTNHSAQAQMPIFALFDSARILCTLLSIENHQNMRSKH